MLFLDKWQQCQKPKLWGFFKLSFSGGGGSTGTDAHTHNSSLAGDGGSLSSSLTQINDANLFTMMVAVG